LTRRGRFGEMTRNPGYRWAVMAASLLATFGGIGFPRFGYSAILPEMQDRLGLTAQQAGSLASWNLIGYVLLAVVGGLLAVRFGPRRVVTVGLFITAVGLFVTGISRGIVSASVARLLTGFGNGIVFVPSIALMSTWFDTRRRGLASGIVTSGSSFALVIVGPVVPRIMSAGGETGWRLAWFFFAGVALFFTIVNLLIMRDRPRSGNKDRDRASRPPLQWQRVVKSGFAWQLGFVYMMWGFAYMIYFVFFQKRLISDLDMTASGAGNLFLILGVASIASGLLWGSISDRIGRRETVFVTLMLQAGASALFAFWPSMVGLVISAVVFGITAVGFAGIVGAACGDRFGAALAPASLGFVTLFVGVGQTIGPILAGRIGDTYSSFTLAYALSAGVFVLGALIALFLSPRRGFRRRSPVLCSDQEVCL